ncbi:MAG: SpoIIE family protein phosphatase [Actinomycetota bacterium]|nr:SpoIIE family protein phosphatase [Actinomycetota bacterium]
MKPDPHLRTTKNRTAEPPTAAAAVASDRRRHATTAVPVDVHAPGSARALIRRTLRGSGVADEVLSTAELLTSEVVTNVVRHQSSRTVEVDVTVENDQAVTVTVWGGAGMASMALVDPPGLPDQTSANGRGLEMLDALTSVWGTRRENRTTALWFTLGKADPAISPRVPARGVSPDVVAPWLSSASDAVLAEAVAIASATEAELTAAPSVVAGRAAITAEHAAWGAAAKTADAAQSARLARAVAATQAADAVAATAARTVEAVQHHADELACEVASAAAVAAATVADSVLPGGDAQAARAALQVGATVLSAALATSEETARTAIVVAQAVAEAAAAVAATTAQAAAAMENEVSDAADAVQAVTAATARRLANDTLERGAALALVASGEAAASQRWQEANQLLLQAGRRDRAIALALQEAMLTHLPESDQLQLAARYLTAAEQDQVGGDWYDALVLPDGSTTLVIGDVIGHDITAASVMGQLRNLLRALLWDRDEPLSAIVTRLDKIIRDLRIDTSATMVVLSVEQPSSPELAGTMELRWTNAGHPAPVLVRADGTVIALSDTTDVLLGVLPDTVRRDHSYLIEPGSTLLLYTDGLIETRHEGIDAGHARLLDALRNHHRLEPDALLDAVLADMVGDHPGDDVAVLAVRFQDTTSGNAARNRMSRSTLAS